MDILYFFVPPYNVTMSILQAYGGDALSTGSSLGYSHNSEITGRLCN